MKIIGLCGGSGSGKGTVCEIFSKNQIPAIDTDKIYRELTSADSECLQALKKAFGNDIIASDGALDRRKLATIVFSGTNAASQLEMLNKISHKFILDETRKRLSGFEKNGYKAAIVDAPVLFESGFNEECDILVAVLAKMETRVSRIIFRDGISAENAMQRINSQMSDEELISRCDYIIYNDLDLNALEKEVESCINKIFEK